MSKKRDKNLQFLSLNDKESCRIKSKGYDIYLAKSNFSISSNDFSFSIIPIFFKLAKEHDIIHYYFPWPFMDLLHFICNIKKPFVITYHSDIVRQKIFIKLI